MGRLPSCQWDTSPLTRIDPEWDKSHMIQEPGTFIAREVERRMLALEMNQKHLARAAGLNETYVRDILKGKSRNPKHEHLAKLADALGCTLNDLLPPSPRKMGYVLKTDPIEAAEGEESLFTTPVPEIDVYAGMGAGGLSDEEHSPGQWRLPTEWLRQEVRGDLAMIRIITLEGDSMADTLDPGDKVVVDLNRTTPSPPGLFVVFDGMALVAKRLEHIEGSNPPRVRIISDNRRYQTYERVLEEMHVVGRIMGRWQRLS